LRTLAAAIETFERDKFSACGHVGNDSRREQAMRKSNVFLPAAAVVVESARPADILRTVLFA
jgi:hypothetical protein